MRQTKLSSWLIGAALTLFAGTAAAQSISIGQPLNVQTGDTLSGVAMFTTFDIGSTAYKATFDSSYSEHDRVADTSATESYKLEDHGQYLSYMGPQYGVRYAVNEQIHLKAAVGAVWMGLQKSDTTFGAQAAGRYATLQGALGNL